MNGISGVPKQNPSNGKGRLTLGDVGEATPKTIFCIIQTYERALEVCPQIRCSIREREELSFVFCREVRGQKKEP